MIRPTIAAIATLRRLVDERGRDGAAALLDVDAQTIDAAIAGLPIHPLHVARVELAEHLS